MFSCVISTDVAADDNCFQSGECHRRSTRSHIDRIINCLRNCASLLYLLTYSELRGYAVLDTLFLRRFCDNAEDSSRAYFELLYQYFLRQTAGSAEI
jgi:hypothetical protein